MVCIGHLNNIKPQGSQKLVPYHDELKNAGACFGVSGGYERPMWFAKNGR